MLPVRLAVGGATGNAWANPRPAETPHRLVLSGGFRVDGSRDRRLGERARVLGFGGLREYLQARCDDGASVPRIAAELGVPDWQVQAGPIATTSAAGAAPAAAGSAAAPLHRAAHRRPRGRAGLRRRGRLPGRSGDAAGVADGRGGRGARGASADGAAAAGPPRDPPGAAHPPPSGQRPTRGVGCNRRAGRRVGRRGWRSSALPIWPATCGHGVSSKGGR